MSELIVDQQSEDTRAVGIRVRVSSKKQEGGTSPEQQEAQGHAWAARRFPGRPVEVFRDKGKSAHKTKNGPEHHRMVEWIESGRLIATWAEKADRFWRNTIEALRFQKLCDDHDVALWTGETQIETTAAGKLNWTMIQAFAQFESDQKSERARDGRASRARAGEWSSGRRPFGYEYERATHSLKPNADSERVLRAFQIVAGGGSINEASRQTGIVRDNLSKTILHNRVYAGFVYCAPDREWCPARHDGIVSVELFDQVQQQLAERNKGDFRDGKRQPFGVIARCGSDVNGLACDGLLHAHDGGAKGRWSYYICSKKCGLRPQVAEHLEGFVCVYLASLATWLRDSLASDEWRSLQTDTTRLAALRDELEGLDAQIVRQMELAQMGGRVAELADARLVTLNFEYHSTNQTFSQLDRNADALEADLRELLDALTFGDNDGAILEWWRESSVEAKRSFLSSILSRLYVSEDGLAFVFKLALPAPLFVPYDGTSRRTPTRSAALRSLGFGTRGNLGDSGISASNSPESTRAPPRASPRP